MKHGGYVNGYVFKFKGKSNVYIFKYFIWPLNRPLHCDSMLLRTIQIIREEACCDELFFLINSKRSYIQHLEDRVVRTITFITSVMEHWLEQETELRTNASEEGGIIRIYYFKVGINMQNKH